MCRYVFWTFLLTWPFVVEYKTVVVEPFVNVLDVLWTNVCMCVCVHVCLNVCMCVMCADVSMCVCTGIGALSQGGGYLWYISNNEDYVLGILAWWRREEGPGDLCSLSLGLYIASNRPSSSGHNKVVCVCVYVPWSSSPQ